MSEPHPSRSGRIDTPAAPAATSLAVGPHATDALVLLRQDHDLLKRLFQSFEEMVLARSLDARHLAEKDELVSRLCGELHLHIQLEDELFYPAVRAAIQDDRLMDVVDVENDGAMRLIVELDMMGSDDPLYDARVTALGRSVCRHIDEEQDVVFPRVRYSKLDTIALGKDMASLKKALRSDAGK